MRTEMKKIVTKRKPDTKSTPHRRALPGPGTYLALAVVIVIVISGRLGDRSAAQPNAGRVVYEADALGRMRRVDAPTIAPKMPGGLWKPQVALVLRHAAELRLDGRQKRQIDVLDAAWQQEKAALEAALSSAAAADADKQTARVQHMASISQISADLEGYSQVSHRYNERRAYYWSEALAVLTPAQRSIFKQATAADRKGNAL